MRRRTRSPASTSAARATSRGTSCAARTSLYLVIRHHWYALQNHSPKSHDLLLTKFAFSRAQVELDVLLPKQRDADASSSAPMGLTLLQLTEWLSRKLAVQEPNEVVRRAFRAFDERAKGFVSLADLEAAVERVAPQLPRHTVQLAFEQIDHNRDGRVGYGEFHNMMRARPDGLAAPFGGAGAARPGAGGAREVAVS